LTATPKHIAEEFRIIRVHVQNDRQKTIVPVNDAYRITVGETVTITVGFTNPNNHLTEVTWTTRFGENLPHTVGETVTYIANKQGTDSLIVTVSDKENREERKKPITLYITDS